MNERLVIEYRRNMKAWLIQRSDIDIEIHLGLFLSLSAACLCLSVSRSVSIHSETKKASGLNGGV